MLRRRRLCWWLATRRRGISRKRDVTNRIHSHVCRLSDSLGKSKLQTEIALSTAEAEYIALSQALREVIPMIEMMKELHRSFPLEITIPNFNCTVLEDNQSCISMANRQKFSPRTKHIALKYHHFRSYVNAKRIEVKYINTHDQLADALTKPLDPETFLRLRKGLIGW